MKPIFYILILIALLSCKDCDWGDFADLEYYIPYNANSDTIIFESNLGDFDTIRIAEIDSSRSCGSIANVKNERLSVSIEHIPIDRWQYGHISSDERGYRPYYQFLARVNRTEGELTIGIEFRDFEGEIILNSFSKENIFKNARTEGYWLVKSTDEMKDSTKIEELYWTKEYGLTGYKMKSGEFYEIKTISNTM